MQLLFVKMRGVSFLTANLGPTAYCFLHALDSGVNAHVSASDKLLYGVAENDNRTFKVRFYDPSEKSIQLIFK